MLNILVVEDEPPLLRDLTGAIESAGRGWMAAAVARDGAEALALLRGRDPADLPDLVITDIRMPVMDGLQLAETIKKEFGNLPVLILTGFKEFEYARRAVSLGVRDYLLKPFTTESLVSALEQAERTIRKERKDLMQRKLENALYGSAAAFETGPRRSVGLLTLIAGNVTDPSCPGFLAGSSFWDTLDLDSLVSESLDTTDFWIMEGWNSAEQLVVRETAATPENGIREDALQTLFEGLSRGDVPVALIAEREGIPLTDLKGTYRTHRKIAAERRVPGSSAIIWNEPGDETTVEGISPHVSGTQEHLLSKALAEGNRNLLESVLVTVTEDWATEKLSQKNAKKAVELIMSRHVENFDRDAVEYLFASSIDLPGMITQWMLLFPGLQARQAEENSGTTGDLILAARYYLEKNFTRNITGEELAKKIGIGASYLSKLFKEKIGMSPPEYLIHLRLQEAKRLLASGNSLMVKDVAEAVGYTDPGHFSRIFKKTVGIWPTEFKD